MGCVLLVNWLLQACVVHISLKPNLCFKIPILISSDYSYARNQQFRNSRKVYQVDVLDVLEEWIIINGKPKKVMRDNGKQFTSKTFINLPLPHLPLPNIGNKIVIALHFGPAIFVLIFFTIDWPMIITNNPYR